MKKHNFLLSGSNTNVNSMINRRVSLFYRYPFGSISLYGLSVVVRVPGIVPV